MQISIIKNLKIKIFFFTGATGFIGKWVVGALLLANDKFSLNLKIYILSRNPDLFISTYKFIGNHPNIFFLKGDIRKPIDANFLSELPKRFDYFIHAATDIASNVTPTEMLDVSTSGTKNILELAKLKKPKEFLLISSGAVYGIQPKNIISFNESYLGTMNWKDSESFAYGLGKVKAESLLKEYSNEKYFNSKIARCFSFVGCC